jgi:hypothetical protein
MILSSYHQPVKVKWGDGEIFCYEKSGNSDGLLPEY